MIIKTYSTKQDNTTKVFFGFDGDKLSNILVGNRAVPRTSGYQFYVDDYVADQIDKVDIDFNNGKPTLVVKEGETINKPQKTEKELRMEELQRELEELKNAE